MSSRQRRRPTRRVARIGQSMGRGRCGFGPRAGRHAGAVAPAARSRQQEQRAGTARYPVAATRPAVEWHSLAPPGDRPRSTAGATASDRRCWCGARNRPPLRLAGDRHAGTSTSGHADMDRLIEWLIARRRSPSPTALVLLLQEAVRGGPAVPAAVPPGMEPPGEIRSRVGDAGAWRRWRRGSRCTRPTCRRCATAACSRPDAQQDRGNAILSTYPLEPTCAPSSCPSAGNGAWRWRPRWRSRGCRRRTS